MSLSINIANVVSVEIDGSVGLFVVDHASGRVYGLEASEVDPSLAGRIVMAAMGQNRADLFDIPREQIAEVMRAKNKVMDDNKKSFRGSGDA